MWWLVATIIVVALMFYKFAPKTAESFLSRYSRNNKAKFVRNYLLDKLPAHGTVLDLGSGDGHISAHIQQKFPELNVVPMDIVDLHVEGNKKPRLFNGVDIPLPTNSVDVVLLCFVLHHTAQYRPLMREAYRVMKPGGSILVFEDVVESPIDDLLTRIHGWSSYGKGQFFSIRDWSEEFRKAGMDVSSQPLPRTIHPLYPVRRCLFQLT